jgi:LPXTG-motif cell wall-anchored protein
VHSSTDNKKGLPVRGGRYLFVLLVLMSLLAPTAYAAQIPGAVDAVPAGTPETVPPVTVSGTTAAVPETVPPVTVSGTTAASLPVTGQSILWIVVIGAVLLCGGIFLFLRTRKVNQGL